MKITAPSLERPIGRARAKGYLLLRHRGWGLGEASALLPMESLASGELAADEERRQCSHESRGHEAPVDRIIGHRSATQHSPDQSPALGKINIGCIGVAGRARVNLPPYATNGLVFRPLGRGEGQGEMRMSASIVGSDLALWSGCPGSVCGRLSTIRVAWGSRCSRGMSLELPK
jgi:hypothetical protein